MTDENPNTRNKILEELPVEGRLNRWGDELFFTLPFHLDTESGRQDVGIGEVAYWPEGDAFCIFFGQTPISENGSPRAYSPVNVFGKVSGDPQRFRRVKSGDEISVMAEEDYQLSHTEPTDELFIEWDDQ